MFSIKLPTVAKELLMVNDDIYFRIGDIPNYKELQPFQIKIFSQMWGSTSGGFEGIGGCAMTKQLTCVVYDSLMTNFFVYFGGRYGYSLIDGHYDRNSFIEDLKVENIKGVESSRAYSKC